MAGGPWFIAEADAQLRESRVIVQMLSVVARRCTTSMSDDQVRMVLASEGYSATELKRLFPKLEETIIGIYRANNGAAA